MMAACHAHAKTFPLQELTEFIETYISIRLAAEKLLERFLDAHRLICSSGLDFFRCLRPEMVESSRLRVGLSLAIQASSKSTSARCSRNADLFRSGNFLTTSM